MPSSRLTIESYDIYHGLPTFEQENLTAIVAGANGLSGVHMLEILARHPQRWKKIYALSRRPPPSNLPENVEHISCDFLSSSEAIATVLREHDVKADYAFFFAYIQPPPKQGQSIWGNVEDLVSMNKTLLSNFLDALTVTNNIPRTVLLQLGAKYYGLHLGPGSPPYEETCPRVSLEPNFYYVQEDFVKAWADKYNSSWITTRPSHIAGAVADNAMNFVLPLAIYATVQKYLNRPLEFPSDLKAWENTVAISSARMNAHLAEWAVLTPAARNGSFNACDDSAFTWAQLWPRLAARFEMQWKGPDLEAEFEQVEMPYEPPPRGWGPSACMRYKFTLVEWAKKQEVQEAWKHIAETHGLRLKEFNDIHRVFGFTDATLAWSFPIHYRYVCFVTVCWKQKRLLTCLCAV